MIRLLAALLLRLMPILMLVRSQAVQLPQLQLPALPRGWEMPELPRLQMPQMPQMPDMPRLRMPRIPRLPSWRAGKQAGSSGADISDAAVAAFVDDATSDDESWQLKVETGTIRVWRRKVAGSKFDELRGNGVLDASPERVLRLLQAGDAETIRQYNPMYAEGYDLQQLDKQTKVSYGTARSIFPFKPRDTVTRVAFRQLNAGGTVLVLHAVDHPDKPVTPDFVRAEIIRGMHLVQPMAEHAGKTNFTFTQQINAGGALPAWLMNVLITQDSVQFVQRLGKVARSYR